MYPPPERLTAELFARLPDRLRTNGRVSRWAQTQNPGRHADCFLEGPSFDRAGNLWMVDVAWGRILKLAPTGEFEIVTEYDGAPNGLKIHRDGRVFIADFHKGLLRLDPGSDMPVPIVDRYGAQPLHGPNDLVFAENGDLYFTDQGYSGLHDPFGRVFRLRENGMLDLVLSGIPSPNGLVVGRDEKTLFVNVTRDNAVWRVPMQPDGSVSKVGAFLRLSGGVGPDGLAMDTDGNLAVAHLGLGAVWLFSAAGEPLLRIDSPAGKLITNVAYGGEDDRTLFMTESETGSILSCRMPVAGRPMFSHSA